jgi:hypothetical protein
VVTSKIPMLPCAMRKGELRFNIWCWKLMVVW